MYLYKVFYTNFTSLAKIKDQKHNETKLQTLSFKQLNHQLN